MQINFWGNTFIHSVGGVDKETKRLIPLSCLYSKYEAVESTLLA